MELETEYQTFLRELPTLLRNEGKFVLIRGREVCDTFDTFEAGLKAGYERFGFRGGFMVKEIRAEEEIVDILTPFPVDDDDDEPACPN